MKTNMTHYSKPVVALGLSMICSLTLCADAPTGWFLASCKPKSYEAGIDTQTVYNGYPSAYLRSNEPVTDGFGTLMQDFRADKYAGKRLRLSAFIKSEGVQDWAGLWMRVDKGSQQLAFDNMQDRPIKGTTGWQKYEVVLDVPQDPTGISAGVLLGGTGTVWLNSVNLEVVGSDVPTTEKKAPSLPDEPVNLNFEKL